MILVSDFAGQMGCQMYLPPSITAITFVALGTSLPDLLASKQVRARTRPFPARSSRPFADLIRAAMRWLHHAA